MKTLLFFSWLRVAALLSTLAFTARAEFKPEVPGPEGERAFRDLEAMYADAKAEPKAAKALDELADKSPEKREAAGRYLLALFQQAYADESNGRAEWKQQIYWGGGSSSAARDYRKKLAGLFGKKATGESAIDAVAWIAEHEKLPEALAAAALVIPRIDSPKVEPLLTSLLAQPHPYGAITAAAITTAGKRKFLAAAPRVNELRTHHREAVRKAAEEAAPALGLPKDPPERKSGALSPGLLAQLADIRQMVLEPVPAKAEWYDFVYSQPNSRGGDPWVQNYTGWLLEEKDGQWKILTWFGEPVSIPAKDSKRTAQKLADVAAKIVTLQKSKDDQREKLSARGGLTAQFEPGFLSVPAGLVSAWCVERGAPAAAAEILAPCLDTIPDDRWITWVMRDKLAGVAHEEMLHAFCYRRDYPRTLALAEHLSKPIFADYNYQDRARKMAGQIRRRADDFKTLKLPTAAEWQTLKETTPRPEQIKYLLARLRLLNCFQWGQPGGVNYEDPQDAEPQRGDEERNAHPVINPYVQLQKMGLEISELPLLAPALADEDFLLTYSYWRDFHPGRTLHQVNWLVVNLLNDAAKRDLAQFKEYQKLDEAGRRKHLEKIVAWCTANAGKSRADLLLDTLKSSKDWREISRAAGEAIEKKLAGAASILMERMDDFPKQKADIAEIIYASKVRVAVEGAREWVKAKDDDLRFWGALVLLRDGDRAKNEGFGALKKVLENDDGSSLYPQAIETLVTRKDDASLALACGILKKKAFREDHADSDVILHLIHTGRQEVLDHLLQRLESKEDGGSTSGERDGKPVSRQLTQADNCAEQISEWRSDHWEFDTLAPDDQRAAKRAELKPWLTQQFALIREGKPSAFKAPAPIHVGRWQVDAP